jgi:hypothetical protein
MKSSRITGGCEICLTICSWLLQILLWAFIILLIVTPISSQFYGTIILIIIIYIVYGVCALLSRSFKYLCNLEPQSQLADYIKSLYQSPAKLSYYVELYHYKHTAKNRKRETSFTTTEPFYYYSWRDISGTFNLANERGACLYYVKLHLGCEVEFADALSKVDFDNMREVTINKYRHMDRYISVSPKVDVDGLAEFKLIKIRPGSPPLIGWLWYVLFTALTLVELYKLYVGMFCVTQDFEIKKLISTRSNLIHETKFDEPKIVLFNETTVVVQNNPVGNKAPELPTREELELANAYDNRLSRMGTIKLDVSAPDAVVERGHDSNQNADEESIPFNQQR